MENEQKYLTKTELAEFTEETLLPAVEKIVDDKLEEKLENKLNAKFGEFKHEIKSYIDDKLADTKGDIIAVIKGEKERDRSFKEKVVEIFKRNKLADRKEAELLESLIH
ncbi:MAG: hypothetical protein WC460_04965 [Patescibacteria group bacterium]